MSQRGDGTPYKVVLVRGCLVNFHHLFFEVDVAYEHVFSCKIVAFCNFTDTARVHGSHEAYKVMVWFSSMTCGADGSFVYTFVCTIFF